MSGLTERVSDACFDHCTTSTSELVPELHLPFKTLCQLRKETGIGEWHIDEKHERFMGMLLVLDDTLPEGEFKIKDPK